jgi:signal transduction histidine kinase
MNTVARGSSCQPLSLALGAFMLLAASANAAILWSHPQKFLACNNWPGEDILHGAVQPRDDTSSGTLYIKFQVDPLSDLITRRAHNSPYQAGLVLFKSGDVKLGVGNAADAWGYSVFSPTLRVQLNRPGELTLASAVSDKDGNYDYEAARRGVPRTFVVKVEFVPHGQDGVTVWLGPDLSTGATESTQPANIVTCFRTDASFDEFRLCHRGVGAGWVFSDIVIATSFQDLIPVPFWRRPWTIGPAVLLAVGGIVGSVMFLERRRARRKILRLEWERALAEERTRIARDLHDDLGARLTEIILLGEMARGHSEPAGSPPDSLGTVLPKVRQLHAKLSEVVWAINPKNDSIPNLAEFLSDHAQRFLENTPVNLRLEVARDLPPLGLAATVRHNIVLAAKEGLNNAVRHAGASTIWLRIGLEDQHLCITVADDGRGFDATGQSSGNGLGNMRARLEAVGGTLSINSAPGEGTAVTFWLPLGGV